MAGKTSVKIQAVHVEMTLTNLKLHSYGVFSNVYRGTLNAGSNLEREIAIKKTWPSFEENQRNAEMEILQKLNTNSHPNLVQLLYTFRGESYDERVCQSLVFEFLPFSLSSLIKSAPGRRLHSLDIRLYAWQLFRGLNHLKKLSICHRDIKPQNLLCDSIRGLLKISDFGSSKIVKEGHRSTPYQVTRYYRPPELLLDSSQYGCEIDQWSGACVMGEMLRGRVLFRGDDQIGQLKLIIDIIGAPELDELKAMNVDSARHHALTIAGKTLFTSFLHKLEMTGKDKQRNAMRRLKSKLLPDATEDALNLLTKVFVYDPKKRISVSDMLNDSYFAVIFLPGTVRANGRPVSLTVTAQHMNEVNGMETPRRLSAESITPESGPLPESSASEKPEPESDAVPGA